MVAESVERAVRQSKGSSSRAKEGLAKAPKSPEIAHSPPRRRTLKRRGIFKNGEGQELTKEINVVASTDFVSIAGSCPSATSRAYSGSLEAATMPIATFLLSSNLEYCRSVSF